VISGQTPGQESERTRSKRVWKVPAPSSNVAELFRRGVDSRSLDFHPVERYPVDLDDVSIGLQLAILAFDLEIVRDLLRQPSLRLRVLFPP